MVSPLDHTGEVFGNYTLVRIIGRGGFGSVYLGVHKDLGTRDAVKVIDDPNLTPQDLQAFKDEAKRVHDLNGLSKHLIAFMEFGIRQPDNVPYFVTPYIPDGDITNHHPKGSIVAVKDVADYLDQLSDGLSVIHQAGLVHRDIKPSNILVNQQGNLVLTDLGIATHSYAALPTTPQPPQSLIGTWEYAAPEQFVGRATSKSDIYSLGILTYEWLCGDVPFHGIGITTTSFIHDIAWKHARQAVPSFASRGVNVPLEIELGVIEALAKDPQDRYDTVVEYAKDFRQAILPPTVYPIQGALQQPIVLPPTVPAVPTNPLPTKGLYIGRLNSQQSTRGNTFPFILFALLSILILGLILGLALVLKNANAPSGATGVENHNTSQSIAQTNVTPTHVLGTTPTLIPTPSPTLSPTPVPTQPPTPTPIPILTTPSHYAGTLTQNSQNTTYQVSLDITSKNPDGDFQGKWYALINGSNEDVFVDGVITPFKESGNFNQIDQQRVQQIEQNYGNNGLLLWFTSTSYDAGSDIWLHCTYYSIVRPDGSVQGTWYAPDNSEQGPLQLHS